MEHFEQQALKTAQQKTPPLDDTFVVWSRDKKYIYPNFGLSVETE
jgi:hypothetical protein